MAYPTELAQQVKAEAGRQCALSGERPRLEAHSMTRMHLMCTLTGKVLDGMALAPWVHQKLHDTANQLSDKRHATSREVFELSRDARNLDLAGFAMDRAHYNNIRKHIEKKYGDMPMDYEELMQNRHMASVEYGDDYWNLIAS